MKKTFLLAVLLLLVCAGSHAADVTGTISFMARRGQKPNLAETVVWLEPLDAKKPPKLPVATEQMLTRGKAIVPHVLAVTVGSAVEFPNDDPIAHNLFSLSPGNAFDLGFYRKGPGKAQKFDKPGTISIYCNVHPNMSAVVYVVGSPYISNVTEQGTFMFKDVPRGKYRLMAANEIGGSAQSDLEVPARGSVAGSTSLMLDARSYRSRAHMNKYGKPYKAPAPGKDY